MVFSGIGAEAEIKRRSEVAKKKAKVGEVNGVNGVNEVTNGVKGKEL